MCIRDSIYHGYDRAYLLKRNADFRSLAAHRLYENRCCHILREERIQTFRGQTASDLAARLDVSARVKVVERAGDRLEKFKLGFHH